MHEVEIKSVLPESVKSSVLESLGKKYDQKSEKTKNDVMYCRSGKKEIAFRLREENGKFFVTEKTRSFTKSGGEVNNENEFEVSSGEEFDIFVKSLGFEVLYTKKKKVIPFWDENNKILIEVVFLENFGEFVEVEKICDTLDDVAGAEQEVFAVIKDLGLENTIESRPYGVLMGELVIDN